MAAGSTETGDLVAVYRLLDFEWSTDWSFDDQAGLLTIGTTDDRDLHFSVTDGQLIGSD